MTSRISMTVCILQNLCTNFDPGCFGDATELTGKMAYDNQDPAT